MKFALKRGTIETIVFKDIYITDTQNPFSVIEGYNAGHVVKNIVFDNVVFRGKTIQCPRRQFRYQICRGCRV